MEYFIRSLSYTEKGEAEIKKALSEESARK